MADEPRRVASDASQFAADIAPVVNEIRLTMMQTALADGTPASFESAGLDSASSMMLGYLRNAYPERSADCSPWPTRQRDKYGATPTRLS